MRKVADAVVPLFLGTGLLVMPLFAPRGRALFEGLCLATLLFLLLLAYRGRGRLPETPDGWLPLWLLAGFALVQITPLPVFLLEIISPRTAQWYGISAWEVIPGAAMPFSVRPRSTLVFFFRLTAGAALYLLTIHLLSNTRRMKATVYFLCLAGGGSSVALILPLLMETPPQFPSGFPFPVIPAMTLPAAVGLYLAARPEFRYGTLGERISGVFRRPAENAYFLPLGAAFLSAVALAFEPFGVWRMGAVTGLGTLGLLLIFRTGRRLTAAAVLVTAVLLAVCGAVLGTEAATPVKPVLETGVNWISAVGTGLGTREQLTEMTGGGAISGYRALWIEGGVAGTGLALLFVLSLVRGLFLAWRKRRRRVPVFLGAGALAGLSVPLMALWGEGAPGEEVSFFLFFLLAGVASAAVRLSSDGWEIRQGKPVLRPLPPGFLLVFGLILAGELLFLAGTWKGAVEFSRALPEEQRATAALRFDPLEESYRYARGKARLADGFHGEAADDFAVALRLSPLTGEYLQAFALARKELGRHDETRRLLEASLGLGTGRGEGYRLYVESLLAGGRSREAALALRDALKREPAETLYFLEVLERHGYAPEEMKDLLPPAFPVQAAYGKYLRDRGLQAAAAEAFRAALGSFAGGPGGAAALAGLAGQFAGLGLPDDALTAVSKGLGHYPQDPALRRLAAEYYGRLGLSVRAEEERRTLKLLEGNRRSF